MNYNIWLNNVNECISSYENNLFFEKLKTELYIFISSWLSPDTKPKIEEQIRATIIKEKIYESQLVAISIVKDIQNSYLIGCNEVVIKHLVKEYSELYKALKNIEKKLLVLKPFNPAKELCEKMLGSFDKNSLEPRMIEDLKTLNSVFEINDFNLSEHIDSYRKFIK